MAADNTHSWQTNTAFPGSGGAEALGSSAAAGGTTGAANSSQLAPAHHILNTGCNVVYAKAHANHKSPSYVDVDFKVAIHFPPAPAVRPPHMVEHNRRIRGQVHVRPSTAVQVTSPEDIYLPMCDAMLRDGVDADQVHLSLRVPLHALTPDAIISLSYYYDRHPLPHDCSPEAARAPRSYLTPRGFCLYGGRILLSMEDVAKAVSHGYGRFEGNIHAVGLDECCERRPATPGDLLASLQIEVTPGGESGDKSSAGDPCLYRAISEAPVNHLHMLNDMQKLNDLAHKLEQDLVAALNRMGPVAACPEAKRLFGRDTTDVFLVPAAAFCMIPPHNDPRNPDAATYAAWTAAAILTRELGSQAVFGAGVAADRGQPIPLHRLLAMGGPAQHKAVLDAEHKRIAALGQDGCARENEWVVLAANMVAGVVKFASYIADDVVCRVGAEPGAKVTGAGRLEIVGTDVSTSWVRSQQSFNGDCDDLARAAYALMQTFRYSKMPLDHPLLEAMRTTMWQHYRTYLLNVTAFAPKAGDPAPGMEGYGQVATDGVRRGVQGHLTSVSLPRIIDGRRVHVIHEGTTDYCVRHIRNPRPRARRALNHDLRAYEAQARSVGLTSENTTTFKYAAGGIPFYDHAGTMASCDLYEDRAPSAPQQQRVMTAAATIPEGRTPRVGVPMDVLLDAEACVRSGVRILPVGFIGEEDLQVVASEGLMLPGMVVPRPSSVAGLSTEQNMSESATRLAELLRGNAILQRRRTSLQDTAHCELLAFSFRSDRITATWPDEMAALLAACPCVVNATVCMQHVYEHLHGIVLALTINV